MSCTVAQDASRASSKGGGRNELFRAHSATRQDTERNEETPKEKVGKGYAEEETLDVRTEGKSKAMEKSLLGVGIVPPQNDLFSCEHKGPALPPALTEEVGIGRDQRGE